MIILSIIRDDVLDTVESFNCYWDAKDFTKEYLKVAGHDASFFNERFASKMNGRVFVDVPGLFICAVEREIVTFSDKTPSSAELAYQAFAKNPSFMDLSQATFTLTAPSEPVVSTTVTVPRDSSTGGLDQTYINATYDLPMGWDNSSKPVRYSQWVSDVFNLKLPVNLTASEAKALVKARIQQIPDYSLIDIDWRRTFNKTEALQHIADNSKEGQRIVQLEIDWLYEYVVNSQNNDSSEVYDDYSSDDQSWFA